MTTPPKEGPYMVVDKIPQVIGGDQALQAFVGQHLITGNVNTPPVRKMIICRFVIDEKGNVTQPEIVRGQEHKELSAKVLKNITMLKFTPGLKGNVPVASYYSIPFVVVE